MVRTVRHRQSKEAANRYARPTATAPHLYSTRCGSPASYYQDCRATTIVCQKAVKNQSRQLAQTSDLYETPTVTSVVVSYARPKKTEKA